jgi:peptide/nickel transport system substrate-binding protein
MHHISFQPGPPSKSTSKVDAAKRLLADSGYAGKPVTLMAPQEVPALKAWGDVTVDLLKRLDMKVDFAALDLGTFNARALQKSPPGQGGWQMHVNAHYGVDADPSTNSLSA